MIAPLFGLIMTGGKSVRMGRNKAIIDYRGKPHALYLMDLLANFCEEVFISCRADDRHLWPTAKLISDQYDEIGPMAGLLSAFQAYPNTAFFVLACDYPFLSKSDLNEIVTARNPNVDITIVTGLRDEQYEPLVAIWEPSSSSYLLDAYERGDYALKRVVLNAQIDTIIPSHPLSFMQANTPEEQNRAKQLIKNKFN